MVAWSLMRNNLFYIFMNLTIFLTNVEHIISRVQHIIFISSECPFHTLASVVMTFQVYIIIYDYKGQSVNQKCDFTI